MLQRFKLEKEVACPSLESFTQEGLSLLQMVL